MADTKISALPASTTPLAGTEVLPIVQSGATKQVSVANLTAGRSVSASALTLTTSPLSVTSGGSGNATAFTSGSVVFASASGVYSQNNAKFFWDATSDNLLIGTTNSSDTAGEGLKLYSNNGGAASIRFVGNTASSSIYPFMVRSSSANAWKTYIDYAGNIYSVNTSITSLSDQRLKENIRDLETGLDVVMALKPRRFDWKKNQGQDKKNVSGFIAQEVETVLPEMVSTGLDEDELGDKYKTVAPGMLIPTLVKAIQDQQQIIEQLRADVTALQRKLS